jgi:Tol biopolymer transport system component
VDGQIGFACHGAYPAFGYGSVEYSSWRRDNKGISMSVTRRRFLRSQFFGLSGAVFFRWPGIGTAATEEGRPGPLPKDTLVACCVGLPPADGSKSLRSGVIAVSTVDGTWRLLSPKVGPFRLSPDCRRIAIVDAASQDIWVCDVADGSARKLADFNGSPVWSPDGSSLVYSGMPQGPLPALSEHRYETWRLKLDGSDPVRLDLPPTDLVTDWSPDGSWLAMRSHTKEPSPGTQIFVCRPDGREKKQLTSTRGMHTNARFSPDGKTVLYTRLAAKEGTGIWINSLDGQSPRAVVNGETRLQYVACWAPDGGRIAYSLLATKNNRTTVEVIDVNTLDHRSLDVPEGHFNGCDWRC